MNIVLIAMALGVLIFGVFYKNKSYRSNLQGNEEQSSETTDEEVLSSEITITSTPSQTPISATITPTVDVESDLIYPGAKVISQSSTALELTTEDVPDKVTDWYKDKIGNMGFSVKSFVTTKTNGRIINKLVGAGEDGEIVIDIEKLPENSEAKISITTK